MVTGPQMGREGGVSPQAGELLQGEDRLHGHVEVTGDAQGQVQRGGVLPALEVSRFLIEKYFT